MKLSRARSLETQRGNWWYCIGVRPRSSALSLLLTYTSTLREIAVGPFYVSAERQWFIGSI